MVLYIHEIEFHRYSIWYIQGQGQGTNPTRKGRLPTTTPGCVWSMHRTGRDPRATVGGRGAATDGRTGPVVVVVVVVVRTRRRGCASVMGARASRVDVEDGSASESA